jgi:hypothetical protein
VTDMPTAILGSNDTTIVYPAGYTGPKDGSQITWVNGQETIATRYQVSGTMDDPDNPGKTIGVIAFYNYYTPITYWDSIYSTANQSSAESQESQLSSGDGSSSSVKKIANTTYHSLLDPGGCDRIMLATLAEDLVPIPMAGPGVGDVIGNSGPIAYATGLGFANRYAINQGLVQPMSSNIFRSMKADAIGLGETAGKAAPQALIVVSAAHALWNARSAAADGTCH